MSLEQENCDVQKKNRQGRHCRRWRFGLRPGQTLGHEGWGEKTVLLEQAELTSGSTSHACGSFRLAYTEDEMDWLRHTLSVGRSLGFNIELVGLEFIAEKHPYYNLEGVIGALYTPDDGLVAPSNVTMAMATGARQKGVKLFRQFRATNITQNDAGEWVVETEQGSVICEHVVNAGGTYARQMVKWSDLQLPMTSMTHHYFVTEDVPGFKDLDTELPVIRDDKLASGYIRMVQKKGRIGIYEKENSNSVWHNECPWEYETRLFEADYDRVMPWLENSFERMPILPTVQPRRSPTVTPSARSSHLPS